MNKKQAAQELGVSVSTIERMVRKGILKRTFKKTKFGKEAVFADKDVKKLKAARELIKG
jgi:excisionase family DNA binding protein